MATQQSPAGLLPAIGQYYNAPLPTTYPGQLTAGFNPIQQKGWGYGLQGYMDAYSAAQGMQPQMARAGQTFMDAARTPAPAGITADPNAGAVGSQYLHMMSPEEINAIQGNFQVNPFIGDQVAAFQADLSRGLQEAMPQTNLRAMMAGQGGSSRHGVLQGKMYDTMAQQMRRGTADLTAGAWNEAARNQLASRGQTLQSLAQDRSRGTQAGLQDARTRADIEMSNARNQLGGYQSRMNLVGQMPNMMRTYAEARMLPSQIMRQGGNWLTGVGTAHQNLAQTMIGNEVGRWNELVNMGPERLSNYAALLSGSGLNQYGTSQQVANQPNTLAQILGAGGALASGLGAIPGLFGAAGGLGAGSGLGLGSTLAGNYIARQH